MDDRRKLELAGWALGAFVLVFLAVRFLHHGPAAAAVPVSLGGPATRTTPSERRRHKLLVVDVEGEVRRPGIQRVPSGSRAAIAVTQAGGLTRHGDATAVNLAAALHDGQQVIVPRRGAVAAAGPGAAVDPSAGAGVPGAPPAPPVSLSSATVAQLDTLDGIGPTLAARIVAYRTAHGGFRSIDELKQVDGIGEKRFASLKAGLTP
jgi:competence protein ComEA